MYNVYTSENIPLRGGEMMAGGKNERGRKKGGKRGKRERGKKKGAKKGKQGMGEEKKDVLRILLKSSLVFLGKQGLVRPH